MREKKFNALSGGVLFLVVLIALFGLVSCLDSSDNKDKKSKAAEIDEQSISQTLDWIGETVPNCSVVDGARASSPFLSAATVLKGEALSSRMRTASLPSFGTVAGDCGGKVTVERLHGASDGLKRGHNRDIFKFEQFCMIDESDGFPQEVRITGTYINHEEGEPGPSGPTMYRRKAMTDGKFTIESPTETITVVLDDLRQEYGQPGTWSKGTPTQAKPDKLTIKELGIDFEKRGARHSIRNIKADVYSEGNDDKVDVASGVYNIGNQGDLRISTSWPLVISGSTGELTGGTLEMIGANGNIVEVTPRGGQPGVFDIKHNGTQVSRSVDCSETDLPILDMLIGMF